MLLGAIAAITGLPWGFAIVGLAPAAGAVALAAVRPGRRTAVV